MTTIYGDAADQDKLQQTLTSIDAVYRNPCTLFVKQQDHRDPIENFCFNSMRVTDRFEKLSPEMMRLADILGQMQKKPQANYEYDAAIEYHTKGGADNYS